MSAALYDLTAKHLSTAENTLENAIDGILESLGHHSKLSDADVLATLALMRDARKDVEVALFAIRDQQRMDGQRSEISEMASALARRPS